MGKGRLETRHDLAFNQKLDMDIWRYTRDRNEDALARPNV